MKSQIKKFIASFGYAFRGLFYLFRTEKNAQLHLLAAILVITAGFYFEVNRLDWVLIALAISFVLFAEAVNTSIEKMMDFISPEYHPKVGRIKDLAAGAVIIAAAFAIMIAYFVFWDKIFA